MFWRHPRSPRTDTLFPYPTRVRSLVVLEPAEVRMQALRRPAFSQVNKGFHDALPRRLWRLVSGTNSEVSFTLVPPSIRQVDPNRQQIRAECEIGRAHV